MVDMKYQIYVDNQYGRPNPESLFFIASSTVEELWQNTEKHLWGTCRMSDYLVSGSVPVPNSHVFGKIKNSQHYYFKAARASITTNKNGYVLKFSEGRHRTRWLLGLGIKYIPLGISEHSFAEVKALGLFHTLMAPATTLDLPVTVKEIEDIRKMEEELDRALNM